MQSFFFWKGAVTLTLCTTTFLRKDPEPQKGWAAVQLSFEGRNIGTAVLGGRNPVLGARKPRISRRMTGEGEPKKSSPARDEIEANETVQTQVDDKQHVLAVVRGRSPHGTYDSRGRRTPSLRSPSHALLTLLSLAPLPQVDLPGGGKLSSAAIYGQDGGCWAQSAGFPTVSAAKSVFFVNESSFSPPSRSFPFCLTHSPNSLFLLLFVRPSTKARRRPG